MKDFKNDSSATLSRFAKDKRLRTVKSERVERRPRVNRDSDTRASFGEQPKRRSYNPNFDSENRPIHESAGGRFGDKPRGGKPSFGGPRRNQEERTSFGGERRNQEERPSFGKKPSFGGKSKFGGNDSRSGKPAGKSFGGKKSFGDKNERGERDFQARMAHI